MSLQPHEIELNNIERAEFNASIKYEAFKKEAIEIVRECLLSRGDLVDTLNTLDLEFDEYESLSNDQINEIVLAAAGGVA